MTKKHRDDSLGFGGGERYLPPEVEAQIPAIPRLRVTRIDLKRNSRLAADLMRCGSNASAGQADAKLRRALAATGFLRRSEAPE